MSIPLIAEIVPKNNGQFALLDDTNIRGGFRIIDNLTILHAIPSDKRKQGMMAFVVSEDVMYSLESDLATWTINENFSGGLSLASVLTGYVLGIDGSVLVATDSILEAFQKLQVQVNNKARKPDVVILTGTTVFDESLSIVLINSATNCTMFLPLGVNSMSYRIRNIGAGKVTFNSFNQDTVEGMLSYQLLTSNAFDLVFCSGNWYIL